METYKKWLKDFKKKLSVNKIKEIYFERGIFVDDIHAEMLLKEFPRIIDPILKRYIEKEFLKDIALKHLKIRLSDEDAILHLNKIRFKKENVNNYWGEFNENERKVLRENFRRSKEMINKTYKRIAKKLHVNTEERDNFPAIIGLVLLITSFVGFLTSFMPTLTGYVTGDFVTGFETGGLNILSGITWFLGSIFGITLIYSTFSKNKNQEKCDLPEFYQENRSEKI